MVSNSEFKMAQTHIVTVKEGQLLGKVCTGVRDGQYFSFQGIPFAKPPIGELRFKAPQPPEPWTGVRDATVEGSPCFSRHPVFKTIIGSEDCLFLNVYTPQLPTSKANDVLKPVMVWIHGGGFISGSGSSEAYGPDFLIAEDIVLVTINYRLGLFGFLAFEDETLGIPGNAGFKDQVMALTWVKRNIKQFGGNPNNVTIFGESAGGASVHCLMLSPMAKGLFHRAICQSGTALSCWAKGQYSAHLVTKSLQLNAVNETEVLKLLEKTPSSEILKLQETLPDTFVVSEIRPFGLVMEKTNREPMFMAEEPRDILISGRYNKVPLMLGYTSREGMLSAVISVNTHGELKLPTNFEKAVPFDLNLREGSERSKSVAEKIKQFFYGSEQPSISNIDLYYQLNTDNFFLRSIYHTIRLHLRNPSPPIYFYRMSVESELNLYKKLCNITHSGVSHADDVGYLFNNLATPELRNGSIEDVSMRRFTKIWATFARTGNPNVTQQDDLINVKWNPVEVRKFHYLDIGENLTVGVNPETARIAFWDHIYSSNFPLSKL